MRATAYLIALTILATGLSDKSQADLVIRVAQTTPAAGTGIVIDTANSATFSVFLSSTVANQSFLGADFLISLSSATGAGGRMVAGSSDFIGTSSSNPNGFLANSFNAPGATAAIFGTIANNSLTLGTGEVVLATVNLSTVGASVGDYTVSLSQLDAIDGGFNQLAYSGSSTLSANYSITAVPEPTSMALLGVVGVAGALVRMRRRS